MILRLCLTHLLVSLFLFTSFTAAWPWPPSYADIEGLLLRRQDNSKRDSNSASASASASASQSATQGSSAGSAQATQTASPSGSAAATSGSAAATSGSQSKSQSGSDSKSTHKGSKTTGGSAAASSAQVTDVDPRLPAGGVNMITPSALAPTTFYKIGETVSFAWNYTSLSVSPSKIDVLVSCSANSATYTLSSNASFASTGSVQWDTKPDETGTAPLLSASYTLIIHDASKDDSAVASAGHLGGFSQFQFGMYVPQSYTPRSDGEEWTCAVCSAALSDTERQALKFMFGMATVTVLSFTWFVGGFGAFF